MIVATEQIEVMVGKTGAIETATLMTSDDLLAMLLAFSPALLLSVGVDLGIEVKAGQESLCSVKTHMAVSYRHIRVLKLSHYVLKLILEPVVEVKARLLYRILTHSRLLGDERTLTEDVNHPIVAHRTERTGLEHHILNNGIGIGAGISYEVVADSNVRV